MKILKKMSLFLMIIAFLFVGIGNVCALDVTSIEEIINPETGKSFLIKTGGSGSFYWPNINTSDGRPAYCYDPENEQPGASDGLTYTDSVDQLDIAIIYILKHGAADPYNPTPKERFITQGAIWLYKGGEFPQYEDNESAREIMSKINGLLANARAAQANGNVDSDVGFLKQIDIATTNMVLEDGYYVSSDIKPQTTGVSTYTVSLSGVTGAEVVGGNNTLNAGTSFKVRVPASAGNNKNLTVKVSIKTKANMVIPGDYAGDGVGHQRIVYLGEGTKDISQSLTLKTVTPQVCVDYQIVGETRPDPNLTDPTPEKKCYDKGTKYNQEKELTTKTKCTFKGWFTKDDLTGKWVDGTALNNDMTLYGAWDCPAVVQVPPTAANTVLISVGLGLILVAAGFGVYIYKTKKTN